LAAGGIDRAETVGRSFRIGGPERISWQGIVHEAERVLGRPIPTRAVEPGEALPGLPPFVGDLLATLEMYDSVADASELAAAVGVELTPIEHWLANVAPTWAPIATG
jgi:hypothetical protein